MSIKRPLDEKPEVCIDSYKEDISMNDATDTTADITTDTANDTELLKQFVIVVMDNERRCPLKVYKCRSEYRQRILMDEMERTHKLLYGENPTVVAYRAKETSDGIIETI